MKKKVKKHTFNRLAGIKRYIGNMLLRHSRMFQISILVFGALASGFIATWALFFDSQADTMIELHNQVRLDIDTIDELEVLIEDRNTTYENPPAIPPSSFGL